MQAGEGQSEVGIVLIHGYGSGVFAWRHIMWPLARATGCRVLAFDRPAFGEPSAPAQANLVPRSLCYFSPIQHDADQKLSVHAVVLSGVPCMF